MFEASIFMWEIPFRKQAMPRHWQCSSAELELAVHTVIKDLPITNDWLRDFQSVTRLDSQLQRIRQFIEQGWPTNINNACAKHTSWFLTIRDGLCTAGKNLNYLYQKTNGSVSWRALMKATLVSKNLRQEHKHDMCILTTCKQCHWIIRSSLFSMQNI